MNAAGEAPLTGRVAIVTGGGRGIGRATALALATAGADVVVAARSAVEIDAVAAEIGAIGRRAVAVACDVTRPTDCQALVEQTHARLGRIDVLVNNAGGSAERAMLVDSDPGHWAETIATNLTGVSSCCRAALPHLIAAGSGKIINVGSGMGHAAHPGNSAYSAAKAGLWMLTRCLALEVWSHGIDVNEVIPGPVATRLTRDEFRPGAPPPFAPSERVKPPAEVADLIVWLATRPPGGPTGQSFSLARRPL